MYEQFISRPEELGSVSGFDPDPRQHPCEHRREWRRGDLCVACDGTGWRKRAAGEDGIDPYSRGGQGSIVIRQDDSESAQRERRLKRLDNSIAYLERCARIREGEETVEDRWLVQYRIVDAKQGMLKKLADAMVQVRSLYPHLLEDREKLCLALAILVPGRVKRPLQSG